MFRVVLTRVATAAVVLAAVAQPSGRVAPTTAAATKSVIGVLTAYDRATRILTVSVGAQRQTFVVPPKASVRLGTRVLTAERLSEHRGAKVKIRYSESDGVRVAESVMLSEPAG